MENTGREILRQVPDGRVDAFVAGIGTGGTIMGVAKALKRSNPNVRIVAVEPVGPKSDPPQSVTNHLEIIDHQVEGIGDGFVPPIVDTGMIDEWRQVSDEDSIETACCLSREKGLFVGISSGANVYASKKVAENLGAGKNVVTVLPDSADRYYTTELFRASCCRKNTLE
jgi:cysteine synthase A